MGLDRSDSVRRGESALTPGSSVMSLENRGLYTGDEKMSAASSHQVRPVSRPRGQVFLGLKIPPFSGKEDEDIAEWLEHYETIAQVQGWGSDAMKRGIGAYFTGLPKRWYVNRMKEPSIRPKRLSEAELDQIPWRYLTWKQVKELLLEHYLTVEPQGLLLESLLQHQLPTDSIVEHFHRKLDICQRLKYSDAHTVNYIRLTLRKDVRPFVPNDTMRPSALLKRLKELSRDLEAQDLSPDLRYCSDDEQGDSDR